MLNSYHLVVDLVEVNLADLVHNVLALERHKGETCLATNQKRKEIFKYLNETTVDDTHGVKGKRLNPI